MHDILVPTRKCVEFFKIQLPEQDESDLMFELRLREDIAEWCAASLSQNVHVILDKHDGLRMTFNTEADMVLFKMRWM